MYIQIYHKIGAKGAIKALQKAGVKASFRQEIC
jgi:hypothetical protein